MNINHIGQEAYCGFWTLTKSLIEDGIMDGRQGSADNPAFVLISDPHTFLHLGTGRMDPGKALTSGKVKLKGSREAFERSMGLFDVSD